MSIEYVLWINALITTFEEYPMNATPWKLDDDDDDDSDCPGCDEKEEGKKEESLEKKLQESFLKNRRVFLWGQVDDKSAK